MNEEGELKSKGTLEPADVSSSKVQLISAIVTPDFADVKVPLYDARISAVPVAGNEDENELLLGKTVGNPQLWYDTDCPRQLEINAIKKEMKSTVDFEVCEEVETWSRTDAQLDTAMSTQRGKVRKHDGTARCRLVVRG